MVETDNVAAGRKMGEFILTHLPENPVIGVVSHVKSSSTAQERYQGLCEGLGDEKEHIVGTVYCDSNYEKAYNRTKALLEEHPDTAGKILSTFFQTQLYRAADEDNFDQAAHLVLLEYLLPALAFKML